MRRLARRLFTLCSAVSLALCVGLIVLWPVSCSGGDEGHTVRLGTRVRARAAHGMLYVYNTDEPRHRGTVLTARSNPPRRSVAWDGPASFWYLGWPNHSMWTFAVVLPLPIYACAALPLAWLLHVRRGRRRPARGSAEPCPACGTTSTRARPPR